jgi:hypothetical protein
MEGIVEVVHRGASHTLRDLSGVWDNNFILLRYTWYQAHGIGRKEFKIKFPLLD